MSTEREFQNARRDYERQIKEVAPSWWRTLRLAVRDVVRAFAESIDSSHANRRAHMARKADVERRAKERL